MCVYEAARCPTLEKDLLLECCKLTVQLWSADIPDKSYNGTITCAPFCAIPDKSYNGTITCAPFCARALYQPQILQSLLG